MRKRPRSRAETKQKTREALIAAGIAEFTDHGFDTSLDAICARAQLTRGAFYVHFADREAFIVAVMQHVLGGFVAALTRAPDKLDVRMTIRLFLAAVRARAPIVHGASGLRFHQLVEACRRSQTIGDTYRGLLVTGRDRIAAALQPERRGLAEVLLVTALGLLVAADLELDVDLDALERELISGAR